MYVISEVMTAVFKKPLSEMRNPFSVSFSSRSPCFRGAAICLNAVAGTVLFVILYSPHHGAQNIAKKLSQMNGSQLVRNDVRNVVHLACAVVPHCQRLARRAVCSHFFFCSSFVGMRLQQEVMAKRKIRKAQLLL